MLTNELIHVEITGKKAKLISGNDCVEEYFLKQMLPWLPKAEDFSTGESSTLAFVSLDQELGFFFYSALVNSLSVGNCDRTITRIMPIAPEFLFNSHSNPALMAYFCFSSGLFSEGINCESLSPHLINRSLFEPQRWAAEYRLAELAEIARAVEIHDRGVLILENDPLKYLTSVYSQIPQNRRWQTSFAIGSHISKSRPFHLHTRANFDRKTAEFVSENQIRYFELSKSTAASTV